MKVIRKRLFALFSLVALGTSIACSKKSSNVSIRMSTKGIQAFSSFPADRRLCFGFDISGSDIGYREESVCAPKRSLYKGFIDDGGTLEAEVPSGVQRQIDLYAYMLPLNDQLSPCPDWDDSLNYGNLYKVGGTKDPVDLLEDDVELMIGASFPGVGSDIKASKNLSNCVDGNPVGFSSISISSSHSSPGYANTGDTITITFSTQIPIDELTASVFGQSVNIVLIGLNTYQITYTIDGTEIEGDAPFMLGHSSGISAIATDGTSVMFDKTPPSSPSAVSLSSPSYIIDTSMTPVFSISGTEVGATVELHGNATCTDLRGTAIASSGTQLITSSAVARGTTMNTFYAQQIDPAGNASACTANYGRYASVENQPFISTWDTTSGAESITLPLRVGFSYNFIVDWGDGSSAVVTSDSDADATHVYALPGTHTVVIGGSAETLFFNNAGSKDKIKTVIDLGDLGWTSFLGMFKGCTSLTTVSGGKTDNVTSMLFMFSGATLATPDTSGWVTTNVTSMASMFSSATNANPDVSGWDTSSVTAMNQMFYNASSAAPVTTNWITSSVVDMYSIFALASNADPDVGGWDVSNVTSMQSLFYQATSANPNVSGWVTSSSQSMSGMFWGATSAAPNVSGFNTSSVMNMSNMFKNATSADPNMSGWDFASVTNMGGLLNGIAISKVNYDGLLTKLNAQIPTANLTLDGGGSNYSVLAVRGNLTTTNSWTITDGAYQP